MVLDHGVGPWASSWRFVCMTDRMLDPIGQNLSLLGYRLARLKSRSVKSIWLNPKYDIFHYVYLQTQTLIMLQVIKLIKFIKHISVLCICKGFTSFCVLSWSANDKGFHFTSYDTWIELAKLGRVSRLIQACRTLPAWLSTSLCCRFDLRLSNRVIGVLLDPINFKLSIQFSSAV